MVHFRRAQSLDKRCAGVRGGVALRCCWVQSRTASRIMFNRWQNPFKASENSTARFFPFWGLPPEHLARDARSGCAPFLVFVTVRQKSCMCMSLQVPRKHRRYNKTGPQKHPLRRSPDLRALLSSWVPRGVLRGPRRHESATDDRI